MRTVREGCCFKQGGQDRSVRRGHMTSDLRSEREPAMQVSGDEQRAIAKAPERGRARCFSGAKCTSGRKGGGRDGGVQTMGTWYGLCDLS